MNTTYTTKTAAEIQVGDCIKTIQGGFKFVDVVKPSPMGAGINVTWNDGSQSVFADWATVMQRQSF